MSSSNPSPNHGILMSQIHFLSVYLLHIYMCVFYTLNIRFFFSPPQRTTFHLLGGDTVSILNVCLKLTHPLYKPSSSKTQEKPFRYLIIPVSFSESSSQLLQHRPLWLRNTVLWMPDHGVPAHIPSYRVASTLLSLKEPERVTPREPQARQHLASTCCTPGPKATDHLGFLESTNVLLPGAKGIDPSRDHLPWEAV